MFILKNDINIFCKRYLTIVGIYFVSVFFVSVFFVKCISKYQNMGSNISVDKNSSTTEVITNIMNETYNEFKTNMS